MPCKQIPRMGVIPIAASIAVGIVNLIITSRVTAYQAAQQIAGQYNYFREVSDQQLTEASFELARAFPQYPYWEWFRLLESIRTYGMIPQPGETPLPPFTEPPGPAQAGISGSWYIWALMGIGALIAYKLF